MSKVWNTYMNTPLKSSRLVRRVILDEELPAGWPIKWGGKWDLAINGKLIPTGLTSLDWTGNQWKDFINKHKQKQYDTNNNFNRVIYMPFFSRLYTFINWLDAQCKKIR